jgi:hypothetical protein
MAFVKDFRQMGIAAFFGSPAERLKSASGRANFQSQANRP